MNAGWARLVFESFGVTAEVETDDPELLASIREVLPPGWRPSTSAPQVRVGLSSAGVVTFNGVESAALEGGYSEPLMRLGSLVRHHMAVNSPSHIFVHAGVVSLDGAAVVIPGRSRSGKTTLVAALMRLGALYYSDEYAVVDSDGAIHPYPKALSIRVEGAEHFGRFEPVPTGLVATEPIAASLIVATKFKEGGPWSATPASGAQAAQTLLANTPAARSRPRDALVAVCAVARTARALSGQRGDADEAAERIRAALAADLDAGGAPTNCAASP
jgi:hypothetical protein